MYVVSFCEDDFYTIDNVHDENTFKAFESGFESAASAYGAGKWKLYLLPRDSASMNEQEHIGEVMRALEEIDRLSSEPKPET